MSAGAFSQLLATKLGRYLPNSTHRTWVAIGTTGTSCVTFIQVTNPATLQTKNWSVFYLDTFTTGEAKFTLSELSSALIMTEDVVDLETATSQVINRIQK